MEIIEGREWIAVRRSNLKYYDEVELYYRNPRGKISLYNPSGMPLAVSTTVLVAAAFIRNSEPRQVQTGALLADLPAKWRGLGLLKPDLGNAVWHRYAGEVDSAGEELFTERGDVLPVTDRLFCVHSGVRVSCPVSSVRVVIPGEDPRPVHL